MELLVKLKVYESSSTVNVDTALLSAYVKAFEEIGRKTGEYPSFSDYASIEGILVENSEDGVEKYKDALMNTLSDAIELALFLKREGLHPEQVQDFYPTPGTISTCMFYTRLDPYTEKQTERLFSTP